MRNEKWDRASGLFCALIREALSGAPAGAVSSKSEVQFIFSKLGLQLPKTNSGLIRTDEQPELFFPFVVI